jgi:HSP20 family protein
MMNARDLIPWTRNHDRDRNLPAPETGASPLLSLQREMNRLFDDVFQGFAAPTLWGGSRGGALWPQIEVEEAGNEYRITAELAGLEDKDVEVLYQDGVLILRGEKKSETEDRNRAFSERVYGRFERRLGLEDLDQDRISATFRNGVLKITAPKSAQSEERVKRIPINPAQTTH